ncbi:MAG: hypothetical protein PHX54_12535 [Lentimicrobiaceae bacterium]|nr:hypothetical protein [Lentimicrobiaceae bacterium]
MDSISVSSHKYQIRVDGIFVSVNQRGAFALYKDGKAKFVDSYLPIGNEFWLYPEKMISIIENQINIIGKEGAGHYKQVSDTIIIQTFGISNDQLCRRSVYETKGVILNDSTIVVFSDYSYWFDSELIKQPNIYRLYKTNLKPDSTLAWFNKKRWYKNNLHESRK